MAGTETKAAHRMPAGFDFTARIACVCADMATRVDDLRHVDMGRVAVSFCQTRTASRFGMWASLTPLRFAGGAAHTVRRGRKWGLPRLLSADGREVLYILNFYLPRFMDLPLREKLDTMTHELWHVGPRFDGDLRRLGGRCYAHGGSRRDFDAHAAALVDDWLAAAPPPALYDFLGLTFAELRARHGRVVGRRIAAPKLIPLT